MTRRIVAIHQPNFFPWLGFFDKIARSDVFILLDDAQFPKSGAGTWLNRVRLIVNNQAAWATMPIRRDYTGVKRIIDIDIDNSQPWRQRLLQTIKTYYAAAGAFADVFPVIERLVLNPSGSLAEYNASAIRTVCEGLSIDASRLTHASTLHVGDVATARLVELVKAVGGTAYLAGGGAGGYQDDALFAAAGIDLIPQQFSHPIYSQGRTRDFVPGLSCLDAVLHQGFAGTSSLLCR